MVGQALGRCAGSRIGMSFVVGKLLSRPDAHPAMPTTEVSTRRAPARRTASVAVRVLQRREECSTCHEDDGEDPDGDARMITGVS